PLRRLGLVRRAGGLGSALRCLRALGRRLAVLRLCLRGARRCLAVLRRGRALRAPRGGRALAGAPRCFGVVRDELEHVARAVASTAATTATAATASATPAHAASTALANATVRAVAIAPRLHLGDDVRVVLRGQGLVRVA